MPNNLPEKFVERLTQIYPTEFQNILDSFTKKRDTVIRVNTLKTTVSSLQKSLSKNAIESLPLAWCSYALRILNATSKQLTDTPEYINGHFYIQSSASLIPSIVLNPKHDELVLDMAAAPGGKTSHIAALMKNKGSIIANDSGTVRIYKLRDTLKRMGVDNTEVEHRDGRALWKFYPEKCNKVLLDAPCSMEARIFAQSEKPTRWSFKNIKNLARLQKYMLRSALSCTQVGGTIVYSTCIFAPEENEGVVQWLLEKEGANIILEKPMLQNIPCINGLTHWVETTYDASLKHTVRMLPTSISEGFFIAVIKKIAPTL